MTLEYQKMKCLALTRLPGKDPGKASVDDQLTEAGDLIILKDRPMEALVRLLRTANYKLTTPIVDETGFSGNVHIRLTKANLRNIPALRKELAQAGLGLVEKRKRIEVMVITQVASSNK